MQSNRKSRAILASMHNCLNLTSRTDVRIKSLYQTSIHLPYILVIPVTFLMREDISSLSMVPLPSFLKNLKNLMEQVSKSSSENSLAPEILGRISSTKAFVFYLSRLPFSSFSYFAQRSSTHLAISVSKLSWIHPILFSTIIKSTYFGAYLLLSFPPKQPQPPSFSKKLVSSLPTISRSSASSSSSGSISIFKSLPCKALRSPLCLNLSTNAFTLFGPSSVSSSLSYLVIQWIGVLSSVPTSKTSGVSDPDYIYI